MASKEVNDANSLEVSVYNYTGGFLTVYFAILASDFAIAVIFGGKPNIDHTWALLAAGFYATLRALGNIEKAILGVTNPTPEMKIPELHFASALIGACIIGALVWWMGISGDFNHK